MAHEVKNGQTLKKGEFSYLFFSSRPPALWQGDSPGEEHEEILAASGRKREEINVAGGMSVLEDGRVVVDGFGSSSLQFEERNPAEVASFIKGLEGIEPEKVIYYGQPR